MRLASYYKRHERNKRAQRKTKKSRKASVLAHLGKSSCERCGYSKSLCALDFHHLDPAQKASLVTGRGTFLEMVEEAKKCIVICANCHREIHEKERIVRNTGRPPSTQDPRILEYIRLVTGRMR